MIKQSNGLEFIYDNSGVAGVKYNSAQYFYRKDVQGNIIAILDSTGKAVVKYVYDAWGNHAVVDANGNDVTSGIGVLNPFRYRGYYYDTETELYYLQTRYYDPELGRFISQDSLEYADPETINGLNLYAYCGNNPVMNVDPTGTSLIGTLFLIVLGVLVSGVISGALAADSREEGESYRGAFLGGFIDGTIGAIAIAAGLATGNAALGFAIAATGSFLGGFVGNIVSQKISYGDIDYKVSAVQGGISAIINSTMYLGLSLTDMVTDIKWIDRFTSAIKFSAIGFGISAFFAQFSTPNVNRLRWKL